ncbi:MAG: serine hydroxymethyltransferase, partial [Planctomycetes bacterium]|nr:serine hydroxymethyltransferase [Planctomycetota bacterium]
LFGCKFANVQPHSGANANLAVYFALLEPGDTLMSVVLSDGGHLTHGSPVSISGKWLKPVHYPLVYDESRADYGYIDYDAVEKLALQHKPKIILCGYSAYSRVIDFERFRAVADKVGAVLVSDIAHIAGLCVGGAHPDPFPHSHIVTTTTHKTLRGPRGGLILTNDEELAKAINKAVFPGTQGGPLMHIITAKAVAFGEALKPEFKTYAKQIVANAKALAETLMSCGHHLLSNGTDNHLMLMDLRKFDPELTGKQAALWLEAAGIIVNKNTVAHEERSPFQTSGIRIGSPAATTRGLKENDMRRVGTFIDRVLKAKGDEAVINEVGEEVRELCARFPLPH